MSGPLEGQDESNYPPRPKRVRENPPPIEDDSDRSKRRRASRNTQEPTVRQFLGSLGVSPPPCCRQPFPLKRKLDQSAEQASAAKRHAFNKMFNVQQEIGVTAPTVTPEANNSASATVTAAAEVTATGTATETTTTTPTATGTTTMTPTATETIVATPTVTETTATAATERMAIDAPPTELVVGSGGRPTDLSSGRGDTPVQPRLPSFPSSKFGNQNRCFGSRYYTGRQWLEYSKSKDSCFCFACRHFGVSPDQAFTTVGFSNWKRTECRLVNHANSTTHRNAMLAWDSFRQLPGAQVPVLVLDNATRMKNRKYIETIAETVALCGSQGIPLRGHDESATSDNRGNFLAIVGFAKKQNKEFDDISKDRPANAVYLHHQIQDELIDLFCEEQRREILNDYSGGPGWYSVICDEARDMARQQQLSLVIRYVNSAGCVCERFICFVRLRGFDAGAITAALVDALRSFGLPLDKCVAQCYDGASVMKGEWTGVQARFREYSAKAVYIHCYAHRLNLALTDTCKQIDDVVDFFSTLKRLYKFMTKSGVRSELLQEHRPSGGHTATLKSLSATRWAARHDAVVAVLDQYSALITTLAATRHRKAAELLSTLRSHHFVVMLHMMDKILARVYVMSKTLQGKDVDLALARVSVDSALDSLNPDRWSTQWPALWTKVELFCKHNKIEVPSPKREQRPSATLSDSSVFSTLGHRTVLVTSQDYKIQLMRPIVDRLSAEIQRRFNGEAVGVLAGVAAFHPDSKAFLREDRVMAFAGHYSLFEARSEMSLLEAELLLFRESLWPNLKQERVFSIVALMGVLMKYMASFPRLFELVALAATIPVTSCSCERSFSCLRRLKNYLRSTMKQDRLNGLALMNFEREILENPGIVSRVVNAFVLKKNRRTEIALSQ